MTPTHARPTALIAAALAFSPAPALAWGPVGHEVVAYIAEDNLTPKASAAIAVILGRDTSLASIANYADQIRSMQPATALWHFIDIPDRTSGIAESDEPRFCLGGNCVVDQIGFDTKGLRDATVSADQRAQFLKFLVHFVGDVHQPLHCADDDDRGGNDKVVRYVKPGTHGNGVRFKLHAVWDDLLHFGAAEDARGLASQLEEKFGDEQVKAWSSGAAADWAWESFKIAHDSIYSEFPPGPTTDLNGVLLPKDYYGTKLRGTVETRLEQAGVRLAMVLNGLFN